MRILWLTPELPFWPGGSGGSTRQYQLIARLVERGDEVEVVAPVHPRQREGAERLVGAGARLHAVQRPASRAREAAEALGRHPDLALAAARLPLTAWQVEVFWRRLRPIALRLLTERHFDVVHIEHDWAARWRDDLPAAGPPTVLGMENLSWIYHANRAASAGGVPARLAHRLEARRYEAFDRRHVGRFDLALVMSAVDQRILRTVSATPGVVVPNGVDTAALVPGPPVREPVALFTGTLDYGPNAEGLEWLLREIWPRIRSTASDARLLVVGKGATDAVRALAGPEVEFAGWVPEMQPWFDRARVVLVPIRSGAGTRLKVLDGLASGRPVVSTTLGAEGIDVTDGADVLVADGAAAFAAATARVLADDAQADRLGAAGRELAERTYDWRTIGDHLRDALDDLVARRGVPGR